jgi:hypothetical protein
VGWPEDARVALDRDDPTPLFLNEGNEADETARFAFALQRDELEIFRIVAHTECYYCDGMPGFRIWSAAIGVGLR